MKKQKVKRTESIKIHLKDPIVSRMCGISLQEINDKIKQQVQPSTEKEAPMPCNGKKTGGKKPPKK